MGFSEPVRLFEGIAFSNAGRAMCQHHGVTEVALCQRAGWPRATFKRHKDFAAGRIAHRLNQLGVGVW
ncbi:hypothetical protein SAMN05216456_1582 [Devosia crocina]|uniref:Uncharacterized protein n=1 Tax=Devosia crocina TaxID=429728 RepID=A0A1I7NC36_9HYPH|nr:hypothetical protein SAMN05216456_1582 [Devosia crocina]